MAEALVIRATSLPAAAAVLSEWSGVSELTCSMEHPAHSEHMLNLAMWLYTWTTEPGLMLLHVMHS